MGLSNGILTAPIGINEVYQCIGAGMLNGECYDIGHICTHVNINKWAKYKPTDYPSRSAESSVTYAGSDGLCGLNVSPSTNLQTVIDRIRQGNYDWAYSKRPNGVGQSFYRIFDFINYDHNSIRPLNIVPDTSANINSDATKTIQFVNPALGHSRNLKLDEMSYNNTRFSDWYWAIVFTDEAGSKILGVMSEHQMKDTYSVPIPIASSYFPNIGTYYGYCMLTNVHRNYTHFNSGETWGTNAYYISCPIPRFRLSIFNRGTINIQPAADYSYSGGVRRAINFDIYGTNKTSSAVVIGTLTIRVSYLDYDERDGERYVNVYTIKQTNNGDIPPNSDSTDLRLGGSLDGSLFSFWDDRFSYYLEVESDNPVLGTSRVMVNE